MKAAIYISMESGMWFSFYSLSRTHTICATLSCLHSWNFPKLTVGFSISNRMMFYSGEILHRAEITLFMYLLIYTVPKTVPNNSQG